MSIIQKFLTVNEFTRPGMRLRETLGIIMHYVGKPGQRALDVWSWFENDCPAGQHFSSANYIIDLNGDIYHAVPDDEVAYHCGTSRLDPRSGRVYTDWAREKFPAYAASNSSPNNCTIGIELCVDVKGNFPPAVTDSAVKLAARLLKEHNLTAEDVGHHNKVVGWKDCPLPWVKSPSLFDAFKARVQKQLEGIA